MPSPEAVVLPLSCPRCGHRGARLQIASASVLTVKCTECHHPWSVASDTVSADVRERVTELSSLRGD